MRNNARSAVVMQFSMEDVVSAVSILTQPHRIKQMATVSKQPPPRMNTVATPNKTIRPTTNTTTLLSQAIDVAELEDTFVKILVYGQNRVGKTTLASTFPKPMLMLSFEPNKTGGANSIKKVPGIKVIRVKYKPEQDDPPGTIYGSSSVIQLAHELRNDTYYQSVGVDSATSFQDIYLQEILGLDHLPEQLSFNGISGDDYRRRSEMIKEGLRMFLNLSKHVIVTAKEKDHNPPKEEKIGKSGKVQPDMRPKFLRGMQQESFFAASLGGAAVEWLHDACDYIARLYLANETKVHVTTRKIGNTEHKTETEEETGRIVRRLRTLYHPNFAAGFRAPDPTIVPEYIEEPTFEKIKRIVDGFPLTA